MTGGSLAEKGGSRSAFAVRLPAWINAQLLLNFMDAARVGPKVRCSRPFPRTARLHEITSQAEYNHGVLHRGQQSRFPASTADGTGAAPRDKALPQVTLFAEQFFSLISLDELTQRRLSDLVGCTLSAWRLLERFDRDQPEVRVYNPDYEKHGWQSTHTAVEVLHPDLPFLVDSVRMELNRRGYSIHTLQTNVLSVRRSAKGELKEILPKGSQGKDVSQESLMYLEIDRCAHAGELRALEKAILEVLGEVRVTVADFEPMKAKARELLTWLGKAKLKVPAEELKEVRSYLEWLLDNHFTFLGYEEFSVADEADGGRMVYDEKSFLGLTRLLRAGLSKDDLHIEDYAVAYLREPVLLSFAKAAIRAVCTARPTRTTCRSASWTARAG